MTGWLTCCLAAFRVQYLQANTKLGCCQTKHHTICACYKDPNTRIERLPQKYALKTHSAGEHRSTYAQESANKPSSYTKTSIKLYANLSKNQTCQAKNMATLLDFIQLAKEIHLEHSKQKKICQSYYNLGNISYHLTTI